MVVLLYLPVRSYSYTHQWGHTLIPTSEAILLYPPVRSYVYTHQWGHTLIPTSQVILLYPPVRSYSYTHQCGHSLIPYSYSCKSRLTRTITHVPREFTDCERTGLSSMVAPCGELELCSPVGYIEQGVRLQVLSLVNIKQHARHNIVVQWQSSY